MDYHGERFLTVGQFRSRAGDLNIRSLDDRELEFYEQHCLLMPVARTRMPTAYAVVRAQQRFGVTVDGPEDLDLPAEWQRLEEREWRDAHPFDRERGRNPHLMTPDCTTFEPWDAHRVAVTPAGGQPVQVPTVERYYAYWQVHVVDLLRARKYFERAPFLREMPRSSRFLEWYAIPADPDWARTFGGKATGYEALTRFGVAYSSAVKHARAPFDDDSEMPEAVQTQLQATLCAHAKRTLGLLDVDEPAFFGFVSGLAELMQDYRRDERSALADDVERDLGLAQRLAHYAFDHSWEGFVAATERHQGEYWSAAIRRLDPVDAAAIDALKSLRYVLEAGLGVAVEPGEVENLPEQIIDFCVDNELFEVLNGLGNYFFSSDDLRRDRLPGFLHRRLRPLALGVEQLTREVLETASRPHYGDPLPELFKRLGNGSAWVSQFDRLMSKGATSDKAGDLDRRVVTLAKSAAPTDPDDLGIARTLALAAAARNLVSHRHRILADEAVLPLTGACARSIALVWLLARRQGVV